MVDARLAADRRIDLRQQRGRQLDVVDAALIAGGGEAGHVTDDAAAQRDDCSRRDARARRRARRRCDSTPASVLYCSPSGRASVVVRRPARPCEHALEVQRPDRLVRDDQQYRASGTCRVRSARVRQQSATDQDRVAALAQRRGRCASSRMQPVCVAVQSAAAIVLDDGVDLAAVGIGDDRRRSPRRAARAPPSAARACRAGPRC